MKSILTLIESITNEVGAQPTFENQPASNPVVQPDLQNSQSKSNFLVDKAAFHKEAATYFASVGLTDQANFQNEMAERELANSQQEAQSNIEAS
ncbi:MAG: hypothetical protein E6R13_05170 [Spirochaetes bacterium]|nr:MAG: hypothetical protein E6R13_05170 [Spirochaetota bacterium]